MKRLFTTLALVVFLGCAAQAQGNGSNHPQWGNWPQYVCDWLDCGGVTAMPQPLALEVVREARSWGQQTFGLSLGQMIQKYRNGELTITYLPTAPPTAVLHFRVEYGGGLIIIAIEDEA